MSELRIALMQPISAMCSHCLERKQDLDLCSHHITKKMAEAVVEQRRNRFYCHQCSVEISPTLPVRTYMVYSQLIFLSYQILTLLIQEKK